MKKCTKCGETKELTEFHKGKNKKDGRRACCKVCQKQYYQANREQIKRYRQENREQILEKKKQYRQKNREKIAEYNKQYRQENREQIKRYRQENHEQIAEYNKQYRKENREKIAERQKQYNQENREKIAEQKKQYRQANREKIAEYQKQYFKENRELFKAHNQKRRALEVNAAGNATAADIQARFDYHGNRCYYCGCDGKMTIEHRIPLSRGGTHYPANIVPACQSCNFSKGTKTESEFVVNRCPTTTYDKEARAKSA